MSDLLHIRGLKTHFHAERGLVRAVDGVDLRVAAGETVALVGESGSGKSVTSLSIMGLVPPPGVVVEGEILFGGRDLAGLDDKTLRTVRGNEIAMIFQDPMTSLNPVLRVGAQIAEAYRLHKRVDRRAAARRAEELLELVGIADPARRAQEYPHQLSGGMRQRVMIAMALSCDPQLLIADEPTTALDVTIQAQILDLLAGLQERTGMGILFVTHDLGVVAEIADRVVVLYAGRVVEEARTRDIYRNPKMPYTAGLLASVPSVDGSVGRLKAISGAVPSPTARPPGCTFHPRCEFAIDVCGQVEPPLESADSLDAQEGTPFRRVRCHRWRDLDLSPQAERQSGENMEPTA
ncbi:MAG: oligopeptide/dipeptide ABC transporter ATP-binding protein [Rhodothermales bacterium]|jgi:oligopeptide/dipeptide ABC transporter ATP-binding protein